MPVFKIYNLWLIYYSSYLLEFILDTAVLPGKQYKREKTADRIPIYVSFTNSILR